MSPTMENQVPQKLPTNNTTENCANVISTTVPTSNSTLNQLAASVELSNEAALPQLPVFDESDCCGNGCANCVLDVKPLPAQVSDSAKLNILNSYTNFTLQSKTNFGELPNVVELLFVSSLNSMETNAFSLNIPSGQHIMMRAPQYDSNGKQLLRPYSPFWVDKNKLQFKILVNLSPNGLMSKFICRLSPGDTVEFRGPIGGQYVHNSNSQLQPLVLVSQGVAIASTLPIVNEILTNEDDMTRIFQFACFTDLKHAYFRTELREFNKFWNYTSYAYLSRQICDSKECLTNKSCLSNCSDLAKKLSYKEKVFAKRLNGLELLNITGRHTLTTAIFVVSGSRIFQEQISEELKNLGLNISDKNLFLL